MIDLWKSSGKDSMTWHFIHMWCSNMTNFQSLPGPASEIFSKDFSSTKNTLFFGGRWSSQPPGNFVHSCGEGHLGGKHHKFFTQKKSSIRWQTKTFHIPSWGGGFKYVFKFSPGIPWVYIDDPIWRLLHAYFSLGVLKWFISIKIMTSLFWLLGIRKSPPGKKKTYHPEPCCCQVSQGIDKWWLCFGHSKGPPGESAKLSSWVVCW